MILEFSDEAIGREAIRQLHSAVMTEMEPLCKIADGGLYAFRQSLKSQQ